MNTSAPIAITTGGSRGSRQRTGPRRIAVNTVAPGAIATDFSGGMVRDNPELNQRVSDTRWSTSGAQLRLELDLAHLSRSRSSCGCPWS
jgi:NAD(P)-dependent dehydrogenase (short-subunit alcohol dehydrogenase family)